MVSHRKTPCSHCGLPVPAGLIDRSADRQFCCGGCRLAFDVIHDHGLERFYDVRTRLEAEPAPARTTGGRYAEFDDPSFHELYVAHDAGGLASVELYLEGVHCAACVWLVERIPVVLEGVAECRLDLGRGVATVQWDPGAVSLSQIAHLLDGIGYPPHPYLGIEVRAMERREERSLLIRIAIAGAIAGNVMVIAFALYGGRFHGISDEFRTFFRWLSLALATPSVLWCASVFHRGAWGSIRTRRLHMDVPISLGILAGFGWGVANTLRGTGEIYFDSVTVLIVLLLAGRFIQRRQQRAATRATNLLFSLAPSAARKLDHGQIREVPVSALQVGDFIEVRAEDTIPADGVVHEGESSLDLSLLTGESRPVAVAAGDPVHAGAVNQVDRLVVEVHSTGENTRIGRLMQLVEEASRRRAPVVILADRISAWFVASVLILAAATLVLWWSLDPATAVEHAVALLIVSCPCALGLATPLAVSAAIGRAARRGILIKGGDALEILARPTRMVLDKTGTLTEGRLSVVRWHGADDIGPLVAAAEQRSSHPVARALVRDLGPAASAEVRDVIQHPGRGLESRCDGRRLLVGSPAFVTDRIGALPDRWTGLLNGLLVDGLSPIVIAVDGVIKALCGLGDPPRRGTRTAVADLRRAGWRLEVLSGDHPATVAAVARQIGIETDDARGGVSPEGKAAYVESLARDHTVVMVGDGVNDAAALAAATVGIGVHGGAEAALAAADVYLAHPGLGVLSDLVAGAGRTFRVIRRNLILSLTYNIVAAALAMSGHMDPLVAAVLMPASSLTVVVMSYRSKTF
jgi:Cu2+-exporting ATPase